MKTSDKMPHKPKKKTAVLRGEQYENIHRLLKPATPAGVRKAFSQLRSLNAGVDDLSQVLNPSVTHALADSWSIDIWHAVAEGLASAPALMELFEAAVASRFAKLPRKRQKSFFEAHIADVTPRLVAMFKRIAAVVNERTTRDDYPDFRHVTKLSDAAAEILSMTYGELSFPRVKALSPDAAEWLGKCEERRGISLGLATLEDDVATGLAKYQGNQLFLGSLATLSQGSARAMARFTGIQLDLSGLKSLSDAAASWLSKYKGDELDLSGLKGISDTAASHLSKYEGDTLLLSGLRSISDAAASCLPKRKGRNLDLGGLTSLSDKAAEAIAKAANQSGQTICLDGLRTLSENAAKALATTVCSLEGLTRLSSTAAQSLLRGGHRLAPDDGISPPKVTVDFTTPITLEMFKSKAGRGTGRGLTAMPKATEFCVFSLHGNSYSVTEGRNGTAGKSLKRSFGNPRSALRSFTNAVFEKQLDGYMRVSPLKQP